jgi:bifunctional non-homologous end joining protein LigD
MTWVAPRVVVESSFVEWTTYHLLRHSSFQGIRTDREASEVVREVAGGSSARRNRD